MRTNLSNAFTDLWIGIQLAFVEQPFCKGGISIAKWPIEDSPKNSNTI